MKPEEKGPVHNITPNGSTALTIHPIPRDLLLQSVSHSSLIYPPFITPSHPFALDSCEGPVEPPSASLPPPLIIPLPYSAPDSGEGGAPTTPDGFLTPLSTTLTYVKSQAARDLPEEIALSGESTEEPCCPCCSYCVIL